LTQLKFTNMFLKNKTTKVVGIGNGIIEKTN
jgi:hypothetical protein